MRSLMELERARLNEVTGSDANLCGHKKENVHGADLVVYTCAVGEDNVELKEAKRLGIPVVERARLLGQLAATYPFVTAIAGAHGKTTTTAMTAAAMQSLAPTVHIGGDLNPLLKDFQTRRTEKCTHFLTEACEYRRSFLELKPTVGAVLNVDLDHTDYYRDLNDVLSAFDAFAKRCKILLVNSDDRASMYLNNGGEKYTFGLNALAYFKGENLRCESGNCYSFDFKIGGRRATRVQTCQPGFHNVYNALCAMSAAVVAGVEPTLAAKSLKMYGGVKRRFERVGLMCGAAVVSDYAHHPKEIRATLLNARKCVKGKVYAVFQPHTYTRTQSLQDEFARALKEADDTVIMPIFPAREKPIAGVTSHNIVLKMLRERNKATYIDTFCDVLKYLKARVTEKDIVVFLGAGDVDKLARSCK